jgi:MFS superfamily sulfate permease-like transporter
MYRFGSPITFFNCDYFKERALAVADAAGPDLRWFVLDAIPITSIDVTGLYALSDLRRKLKQRGTTLAVAGRRTEFLTWLSDIGLQESEIDRVVFPTMRQALRVFLESHSPAEPLTPVRGIS